VQPLGTRSRETRKLGAIGQASEGGTDMACTNTYQIFSVNPVPAISIKARIQNYDVTFVLDTEAAVTLLRGDKLAPNNPLETWTGYNLVGVEGFSITSAWLN